MSRLIDADRLRNIALSLRDVEMVYEIDQSPTVEQTHGECKTCKHYVKGGLDGKTYVCEHPSIEQDDYYNYACITMDENDFCSCYEKKEGKTE